MRLAAVWLAFRGYLAFALSPNEMQFCQDYLSTTDAAECCAKVTCEFNAITELSSSNLANEAWTELPDITLLDSLIKLSLPESRVNFLLSGTIPSSISWHNQNLLQLNVRGHSISGTVPVLPPKMQDLQIGFMQLSGTLPALPSSLESFNANWNQLSGSIPALNMNPRLYNFKVSHNDFDTLTNLLPVPAEILCEDFDVDGNKITGTLPNIISCSHVALDDNYFSGTVPVLQDSRRQTWDFGENQLHGQVNVCGPASSSLRKLVGDGNEFSEIVAEGDCSSLNLIDLGSNKLNGTLPEQLGAAIVLNTLILKKNTLRGPVPQLASSTLQLVDLYQNNLDDFSKTMPDQQIARLSEEQCDVGNNFPRPRVASTFVGIFRNCKGVAWCGLANETDVDYIVTSYSGVNGTAHAIQTLSDLLSCMLPSTWLAIAFERILDLAALEEGHGSTILSNALEGAAFASFTEGMAAQVSLIASQEALRLSFQPTSNVTHEHELLLNVSAALLDQFEVRGWFLSEDVARHLVICISEVLHSQGCGLFDFANSLLDQVSALSQACSSCGGQTGSPGNQSNLTFSVSHRETTVSSMRVFSGQALLLDSGNGARVEMDSDAWASLREAQISLHLVHLATNNSSPPSSCKPSLGTGLGTGLASGSSKFGGHDIVRVHLRNASLGLLRLQLPERWLRIRIPVPGEVEQYCEGGKNCGDWECRFFDEVQSIWSSEGCVSSILPKSSTHGPLVECQCSHLTEFAAALILNSDSSSPSLEMLFGHPVFGAMSGLWAILVFGSGAQVTRLLITAKSITKHQHCVHLANMILAFTISSLRASHSLVMLLLSPSPYTKLNLSVLSVCVLPLNLVLLVNLASGWVYISFMADNRQATNKIVSCLRWGSTGIVAAVLVLAVTLLLKMKGLSEASLRFTAWIGVAIALLAIVLVAILVVASSRCLTKKLAAGSHKSKFAKLLRWYSMSFAICLSLECIVNVVSLLIADSIVESLMASQIIVNFVQLLSVTLVLNLSKQFVRKVTSCCRVEQKIPSRTEQKIQPHSSSSYQAKTKKVVQVLNGVTISSQESVSGRPSDENLASFVMRVQQDETPQRQFLGGRVARTTPDGGTLPSGSKRESTGKHGSTGSRMRHRFAMADSQSNLYRKSNSRSGKHSSGDKPLIVAKSGGESRSVKSSSLEVPQASTHSRRNSGSSSGRRSRNRSNRLSGIEFSMLASALEQSEDSGPLH